MNGDCERGAIAFATASFCSSFKRRFNIFRSDLPVASTSRSSPNFGSKNDSYDEDFRESLIAPCMSSIAVRDTSNDTSALTPLMYAFVKPGWNRHTMCSASTNSTFPRNELLAVDKLTMIESPRSTDGRASARPGTKSLYMALELVCESATLCISYNLTFLVACTSSIMSS